MTGDTPIAGTGAACDFVMDVQPAAWATTDMESRDLDTIGTYNVRSMTLSKVRCGYRR